MKRRSSLKIMKDLIVMVKPLIPVMCLAVLLGVTGYLCAVSLTIIAGYGIADVLTGRGISSGLYTVLIIAAVARGFLHYGEQYCNHYIAFRILALVRHKVFAVLRKLCPAKLEGRDKGNLISILTTDIELLEVFYAHTISPIMIALLVSLVMVIFQMRIHPVAGLWALSAYIVIGVIIPVYNGRRSAEAGMEFRNEFGELNSQVLGMLYGLDETIRYNDGVRQNEKLEDRSRYLGNLQGKLNRFEASLNSVTGLLIQVFSLGMFLILSGICRSGQIPFDSVLIGTVAMMGSFGPVVALANLSNTLSQTLASGERVLSLLEEEPVVKEVTGKQPVTFDGAEFENVTFAYSDDVILKDFSFVIPENRIIGIHGASGSGKSTLLKLLMRFWDIQKGSLRISDREIREINTSDLRNMESYITQETWLFNDTIAGNIAIGNIHATREEIIEAAKKASIHDFIEQLPEGYDTNVGELGDRLSGGERQRIGIARAFLHESDLLLMDEPTSNLDSLNEGIILKSLKESSENKTVVLVSHRKSTVSIADTVFEMDQGRVS